MWPGVMLKEIVLGSWKTSQTGPRCKGTYQLSCVGHLGFNLSHVTCSNMMTKKDTRSRHGKELTKAAFPNLWNIHNSGPPVTSRPAASMPGSLPLSRARDSFPRPRASWYEKQASDSCGGGLVWRRSSKANSAMHSKTWTRHLLYTSAIDTAKIARLLSSTPKCTVVAPSPNPFSPNGCSQCLPT